MFSPIFCFTDYTRRPFFSSNLPILSFLSLAAVVHAAPITWETPQTISGASDVSTEGVYFGSWAPFHGGANTLPVNGVTFQGNDDLGITQTGFADGGNYFGPHVTADTNYNTLLGYGAYANGTYATFTINGNNGRPLSPGRSYLVQFWVSDARLLPDGLRTETISGSETLDFPATGNGAVGKFVIGRFTADAENQLFELDANSSAQINLLQVRDVTPVSGIPAYFNGANATVWDTGTTAAWSGLSGGPYTQLWSISNSGIAVFEGTAGTVAIDTQIDASGLTFNTTGYVLSGFGGLALSGTANVQTGAGTATIETTLAGVGGMNKLGTGTLILSGLNAHGGPVTLSAGVLELSRELDTIYTGNPVFSGPGTLRKTGGGSVTWGPALATFAMPAGSLIDIQGGVFKGGSNANEDWTANQSDLNIAEGATFRGTEANVRVNGLTGSGILKSGYNGSGYSTFTFGVGNGSGTFSGVLADDEFPASFTKTGTGTQVFSGPNTWTGSANINAGTLSFTLGTLPDAGTISIASGAFLNLDFSGEDLIGRLFLNGTQALAGRWGRVGSVAAQEADYESSSITGTGILIVNAGPPYVDWAASTITAINPAADATPGGDPDKDGTSNSGEFALNGNPLSGLANDKVLATVATVGGEQALTLTLPVRTGAVFAASGAPGNGELVSAATEGVVYRIQGSRKDLTDWTLPVTEVTGDDATAIQSQLPVTDPGWTYRTFRTPGTPANTATGFIRVRAAIS